MEETSLYKKPYQSLFILVICIFVSEIAIMFFLPLFPDMPAGLRALLDASLLIILSLPALYLFGFRPLMQYITEHRRIEGKLQRSQLELEERVAVRTEVLRAEIVARKKIEEELKESEFKYRTLVEQIPAVTYIVAANENNSLVYVSPQIQKILGFSPDEYKKDPDLWRRQLHPDDHDRVLAELLSSRVSGKKFISEYRMLAKNGRIVYFHNEAVVARNANEKNAYLQGVMYDITAHKKADENLRKANIELESRIAERTQELFATNRNLQQEISECRRAEEDLKEKMLKVGALQNAIVEIEQKITELKNKLSS